MVDVRDKLKISYESLEREQKEIFLDIAFLFIGMDVRLVIPMWKDAKYSPEVGIEILQLKSLIKIGEDNTIWMHDQLRDLGRSTVEQEDKEPGWRSRLWHGEDAFNVLVQQQVWHFRSFPSLESLILESCGELVWVDPSIVLLKNLILLNLRGCRSLEKLPEQLGSMESLVELLIDDTWVKELPILRGMKKLEVLSADSCTNLHEIPASVGSLVNLRILSLSHSGLKELPNSIGQLTSLVELILTGTDIRRLPDFIGDLHDLEVFMIDDTYVSGLPGNLGNLKKLKVLDALGQQNTK
ncbi:TMV resistance protein N-like [Punica granatum]|uniref:TMV resistance protein N-like n=1 Tax=Punica granatum TaxID=22663 RepID=A0A6P8CK23_PUNGR|nr:TMV resistance protein N-like [Punica granatum]